MLRRILTMLVSVLGITVGSYLIPGLQTNATAQGKDKNAQGRKLYREYCASCHGTDGKGSGPVASALKTAPADLTMISKNNGKFPALQIKQVIAGETDVTSPGSREMPVWGAYFRRAHGSGVSAGNVYALMKYIESIQQ